MQFKLLCAFCILLLGSNCLDATLSKGRHRSYLKSDRSFCSSSTLSPSINSKPLIMIDAGHGGADEGAKVGASLEKKIALKTAQLTKSALELRGYEVRMTRSKDEYVSLPKRVEMADVVKAKLFLSFHCNSSPNAEAHGVEIFYYESKDSARQKASRRLASVLLHNFLQYTSAHSRGVKRGNFHVIRETSMPSVLIEMGFLTNFDEREKLKNMSYLEKISQGIAHGIDRYFNY